jgi:hypothetical protein
MLYVVALLSIPLGYILNGLALSVMWRWFMTPVFNLPALSIAQAIGVSIVVGFLSYQHIDTKKDEGLSEEYKVMTAIVVTFLRPLFALFIAWIVHLFM